MKRRLIVPSAAVVAAAAAQLINGDRNVDEIVGVNANDDLL